MVPNSVELSRWVAEMAGVLVLGNGRRIASGCIPVGLTIAADPSTEVKVKAIYVGFEQTLITRTRDEAMARIDEVLRKLKDGADFSALAKQYSDDRSASTGGEFGTLRSDSVEGETRRHY